MILVLGAMLLPSMQILGSLGAAWKPLGAHFSPRCPSVGTTAIVACQTSLQWFSPNEQKTQQFSIDFHEASGYYFWNVCFFSCTWVCSSSLWQFSESQPLWCRWWRMSGSLTIGQPGTPHEITIWLVGFPVTLRPKKRVLLSMMSAALSIPNVVYSQGKPHSSMVGVALCVWKWVEQVDSSFEWCQVIWKSFTGLLWFIHLF